MLDAIHSYGGIVLHDVISIRHAKKALEAGVDGLILVASGAGGHAGTLSPFALVGEVRKFFDGPLALSGSIATGDAVLARRPWARTLPTSARAGWRPRNRTSATATATPSWNPRPRTSSTPTCFGVHGNYLKKSIVAAGLDPEALPEADKSAMNFGSGSAKAWRDIWGAARAWA
jgi:nitronate monooxygenase